MKNTILYYYGLEPFNIHQKGKNYYFYLDHEKYYFLPFYRPIDEAKAIYSLNQEMLERDLLVHEIILNKYGDVISMNNGIAFFLVKLSICEKGRLHLSDLHRFSRASYRMPYDKVLEKNDWGTLWSQKIDYFEYQMTQMTKEYPLIRESFSYFVGMAENAIAYVNDTKREVKPVALFDGLTLSHRRIHNNLDLYDFYHPLNIIVDHKARDLAEYVKTSFFRRTFSWDELEEYFQYNRYSTYGYQMFFGRLLFPTFYFDLYENIMEQRESEKKLWTILERTEEYEEFLCDMYYFIKKRNAIKDIPWLTKRL